ncbi:MAG: sulfate/molybdate ABC transporter ATP-binding protein [Spirochaetes bacterium]|nr:sulfate/molybdate ABC transporter ATP-binding protein [Spirochaetota bacterium]
MSLYIDIEKTFPDFRLSLQLDAGDEVVGLLGSSGCGKSLSLKCIAGIETPDKGRIVINGDTVFDSEKRINIPPQQRHTGFLFQNYALFPTKTVWNNISSVIQKPKAQRDVIVADIVKLFQLEGVKNLYPMHISGGQQQRVALARILVSQPKILLLDEPFSALDTHLKWKVEQEIAAVLADFSGTTIFVSHDRSEAYRMSAKIAVMENGEIESAGTREDVFNSPKTLAAALITGCKNVSAAEKIEDHRVQALDWGINLQTKNTVPDAVKYVAVRSHHFECLPALPAGENAFPCYVRRTIEEPFEKIIEFSFSANSDAKLHCTLSREKFAQCNCEELFISVPADKIIFLEG